MNIFDNLTNDELNTYTYLKSYKAKDVVFNEEQIGDVVGMVIYGQIDVIELTYTEKEETITILQNEAYFGDILAFSKHNRYLGHGICLKKTLIRYISKENLFYLFKTNYQFLASYLELLSTKALYIKQENKLFKHKNIEDRIIYYLKLEQKQKNTKKIYIESVSNLARILSLPRPSVSRSLSFLEKKHIIKKEKEKQKTYLTLNQSI